MEGETSKIKKLASVERLNLNKYNEIARHYFFHFSVGYRNGQHDLSR